MADDFFVFFDVETTGLAPAYESVCEIGAVKTCNGQVVDQFQTLINPKKPIPYRVTMIHGIGDEHVRGAPTFKEAAKDFLKFIEGTIIFAYNAPFDLGFINWEMTRINKPPIKNRVIDVLAIARKYLKLPKYNLAAVAEHFSISSNFHRGLADAQVTAQVFARIAHDAALKGVALEECLHMFNVNDKT
jgi:DNA polymerase-3 subunit alpha (Gram-positive type)